MFELQDRILKKQQNTKKKKKKKKMYDENLLDLND